eukprot:1881316-Pyramimonas_sp.AAC.1
MTGRGDQDEERRRQFPSKPRSLGPRKTSGGPPRTLQTVKGQGSEQWRGHPGLGDSGGDPLGIQWGSRLMLRDPTFWAAEELFCLEGIKSDHSTFI